MDDYSELGLRERKKAKTRALIQEQALRLFREQGYDATTIEQIADVAEVSPSTVFRYFPSKPDLVISDDMDELMIEKFKAQPRDLNTIQALHATIRSVLGVMAGGELEAQLERSNLMLSVPEIRAAFWENLMETMREICNIVAERTGRSSKDAEILALSGAVIGVAISAWIASDEEDWIIRYLERIEIGLDSLESGFRL